MVSFILTFHFPLPLSSSLSSISFLFLTIVVIRLYFLLVMCGFILFLFVFSFYLFRSIVIVSGFNCILFEQDVNVTFKINFRKLLLLREKMKDVVEVSITLLQVSTGNPVGKP